MRLGSALRRLAGRSRASQSPPGTSLAGTAGAKRFPIPLPGIKSRGAGEEYLHWFVELAGLTPDEAVLEPGCGTGRMAEPLSHYLSATGSYDGFDVVPGAIEWCEKNIAPEHPNFRFRHVDVLNRAYNPDGRLNPEEFEFPYPAEAFDFAFLTSVFTHMLPPEMRHYLSEIRRVLRPGGRSLMTFFLLNEESLDLLAGPHVAQSPAPFARQASRRFAHKGDGYFYDVPGRPEAAVAYREEDVLGFLEQAGFEEHVPIRYGHWTGRRDQGARAGQDIVVVKRFD
jgi:SAM-dependent methyltransferase